MLDFVLTVHGDDRETIIRALEHVAGVLGQATEIPIPCFESGPRIDDHGRIEDEHGRLLGSFGLEAPRG